jgi:SAM-dependent methyltransferase
MKMPTHTEPRGDFDYDRADTGYTNYRKPDPRIAARIHAALGGARTVLNVGAGAGSYEPTDRHVVAVEPSASMRGKRPRHLAPALNALAENLPFDDGAFDAAMAMLTMHQWPDKAAGLRELRRVTRGPIVILTFDWEAADRFWLAAYSPEHVAVDAARFPKIHELVAMLGGASRVRIEEVPIPLDCTDGVTEAYYGCPERMLDPAVRAAQSVWGFVDASAVRRFTERLGADLASGAWDERYGHLRRQPEFAGAMRLVIAT